MIDSGVTLAERYKIIAPIGSGGMGEVYRARDRRLERDVAIKVLPEEVSKDHHSLARFEREAKALAALSHPNILTIYDFVSDNSIQFAVTELLMGQTLRSRMDSSRLTPYNVLEIAATIANGLAAAHSAGVIHRDLKPENIFITSDGTVKILDFGLARWEKIFSAENPDDAETVSQTEKGTIIGTIPYMSPEQVKGDPVDVRSDIFSFGTMVYEMFTGNKPFTRKTKAETIAAIVYENPPLLPESEMNINAEVSPILQRCLEKKPEKRFQSAHDLAFDLRTILNRSKQQAPTFRSPFLYLTILLSVALIGVGIYYFSVPHGKPIHSIAVLPFLHSGDDPDTELFSDGITDNIINTLSQLPELRVMARSTVFTYKDKEIDPRKIGNDLKVGSVLTGKVVKQKERLIVQTELVEVATGLQLWGRRFDEDTAKIFDVQEEISSEISDSLRLRISGPQKQLLKKHFTDNTKAYQLYQQGRYHWFKDTYEGYEKSQHYFNLAIKEDPNYALAYSGLADAYIAFAVHGLWSPKESFPKAEGAAKTALKIDHQLAEAHASLGLVRYWQWDWKTSEQAFRRAIALNPNYAEAYHFLAVELRNLGRSKEAIDAMKKALELDPLSLATNTNLGSVYFWTGHYDEAINQYRKTLEMDPNWTRAHDELADAYVRKGLYQQASLEKQKALTLAGVDDLAELFDQKFDQTGYSQALETLYQSELDYRSEVAKEKYVSPMAFAYLYSLLGRKDEAFESLENAYQERSPWLAALKADPQFDSIRKDARFRNLLQRIGLPE